MQYRYNGLGQRVLKGFGFSYSYEEAGHVIEKCTVSLPNVCNEYSSQQYIWLGDIPVAALIPYVDYTSEGYVRIAFTALVRVHSDHLNTPRRLSGTHALTGSAPIWRWDSDPFGTALPDGNLDDNPDRAEYTLDLRFAGQVWDWETGLHYNYFRDCFDPATGRYCQPDPMGVREHALTESIGPALMKGHGKPFARAPLELNPYAYVVNHPVSRIDPTGADEVSTTATPPALAQ